VVRFEINGIGRSDPARPAKLRPLRRRPLRIQRHEHAGRRPQRYRRAVVADQLFAPCIWTRWCSGAGKFRQRSRIIGVDEQNVLAEAAVEFELKEMEGHATNVHYFGGVQFQQFGLHHVEIYLQEELRLRFPLPVVRIQRK